MRINLKFAGCAFAIWLSPHVAIGHRLNRTLNLSKVLADTQPESESNDGPLSAASVNGEHGVVMNVYQGDANLGPHSDEEGAGAEDSYALAEADEAEVDKLANTVNRLNIEDEEGEKEDMQEVQSEGRHADTTAEAMTETIASELKGSASDLRKQEAVVEGQLEKERESHNREMSTLSAEERAEREKAFTEEARLKRQGHEAEAKLKDEEQLLKEDEENLKDDRALAKEQLAGVEMDESERLAVLKSMADLRSKTAAELTETESSNKGSSTAETSAGDKPLRPEKIIQDACSSAAVNPTAAEGTGGAGGVGGSADKKKSVSGCADVFASSSYASPSAVDSFRQVPMRDGIASCQEPILGPASPAPGRAVRRLKSSQLRAVVHEQHGAPPTSEQLPAAGTGCERCDSLDDCLQPHVPPPQEETAPSCEKLKDPRPYPRMVEVDEQKKTSRKRRPKHRPVTAFHAMYRATTGDADAALAAPTAAAAPKPSRRLAMSGRRQ